MEPLPHVDGQQRNAMLRHVVHHGHCDTSLDSVANSQRGRAETIASFVEGTHGPRRHLPLLDPRVVADIVRPVRIAFRNPAQDVLCPVLTTTLDCADHVRLGTHNYNGLVPSLRLAFNANHRPTRHMVVNLVGLVLHGEGLPIFIYLSHHAFQEGVGLRRVGRPATFVCVGLCACGLLAPSLRSIRTQRQAVRTSEREGAASGQLHTAMLDIIHRAHLIEAHAVFGRHEVLHVLRRHHYCRARD
mmetsp:Transcript_101739/g.217858  ORF Transcript_101739/g.217858 Transcript_101739/m.217858 type:complete len:244 (+) Transcript_101739:796-1527(+)